MAAKLKKGDKVVVLTGKDKGRQGEISTVNPTVGKAVVEGINTNIALHRELMLDARFTSGGTNIHYLEEWLGQHKR